jgi:hypothetical protein
MSAKKTAAENKALEAQRAAEAERDDMKAELARMREKNAALQAQLRPSAPPKQAEVRAEASDSGDDGGDFD